MFKVAQPASIAGLLGMATRPAIDHAVPYTRLGKERGGQRSVARTIGVASLPRRGDTIGLSLKNGVGARGFAVVRSATEGSWWEIENLLLPPDADDLCLELVPQLDKALRPKRGTTIFVRVPEASPLTQTLGPAGFRPYTHEELFVRPPGDRAPREIPANVEVTILPTAPDFRLFRIHTSALPVEMRVADGITLREWQEALATRWIDVRKTMDIVASSSGAELGWARCGQVSNGAVLARCATAPGHSDAIEALIESVIQASGRSCSIMFLVPEHDAALGRALGLRGFHAETSYRGFALQMGRRVLEGAFAPVGL